MEDPNSQNKRIHKTARRKPSRCDVEANILTGEEEATFSLEGIREITGYRSDLLRNIHTDH